MSDKVICKKGKASFFPNNEMFFIIGGEEDDDFSVFIPEFYYDRVSDYFEKFSVDDIFDLEKQNEIVTFISEILDIDELQIEIRNSLNYAYLKGKIQVSENNKAVYNREFDFSNISSGIDTESEPFRIFKNFTHCTMVFCDNQPASFCCTENGVISVETHPDYLKQGFGSDCLELLTYHLIRENAYKEINFPTTVENEGAVKIAEKTGYELISKGIWIVVNTDKENFDEKFLNRDVGYVKDYR